MAALGYIFIESHHRRKWDLQIGGSNGNPFMDVHYGHFATKDQLDGFLPVADTERKIGHGLKGAK